MSVQSGCEVITWKEVEVDYDLVRHMVGASPHRSKKHWGFRNYFAASLGGRHCVELDKLIAVGFVSAGQKTETMQYYHATVLGCKAIGLTKSQIARVFAP